MNHSTNDAFVRGFMQAVLNKEGSSGLTTSNMLTMSPYFDSCQSYHPFSSCITIAIMYSLSDFQLRTLKPMVDSGAEWEAKRCEIRSATAEVKTGRLKILVLLFWMGEGKRVRLEGL